MRSPLVNRSEAVVEAIGDDVQRHRPRASRRELQCERDAVEARADATDRLCIVFGQCEVRQSRLNAGDEQLDRRVST